MSGNRAACSSNTCRKNANDLKTLALSAQVTRPMPPTFARCFANSNEKANSFSDTSRVITIVSRASRLSSMTPLPRDANSPSVDSRTMTKSMGRVSTLRSGDATPGMLRMGRTPAKSPNSLRRSSCGAISVPSAYRMCGNPIGPKRMASAVAQAASVAAESACPVSRNAAAPATCHSSDRSKPPTKATAVSSSSTHGCMTSGPIPSPGRTAIRNVDDGFMEDFRGE